MRPLAVVSLAVVWGVATSAAAQDGFRAPGGGTARSDRLAAQSVESTEPSTRLLVFPLNGQGLTFSPSSRLGAGLRLPAEFQISDTRPGGPATFGIAPPLGTALDYKVDRWTFSSAVRQDLASARSGPARLDLGASYGFNPAPRHELVLFGGLGIAAAGMLPGLPGDEVAVRSALDPYRGGSGLRDMGLRLSWRYSVDRRVYVDTSVGIDRNFGDPAVSGAFDRNVGSVGAVFGYRFY